MAITQGEVLTQAQDDLDERTSGRTWTPESLRRWANRAAEDISRKTLWKRASEDIDASADTQTYNLAADCLLVHTAGFTYDSSTSRYPLTYADQENVEAEAGISIAQARGVPQYFYTWGYPGTNTHKINLYPTPSDDGTIDVNYFAVAGKLATADTSDAATAMEVPPAFEEFLVLGVVWRALKADGDNRWQDYKSQFDEQFRETSEITIRYSTQPGRIMSDTGRGIPQWLHGGYGDEW